MEVLQSNNQLAEFFLLLLTMHLCINFAINQLNAQNLLL